MSDDDGFNEGLALWVQQKNDLHYVPEILKTEWEDAYESRCGEGTCDFSEPSTFTIYYTGHLGERKSHRLAIEDYGFSCLVKEIAELMP